MLTLHVLARMASRRPARSGHGWHCGREEAGDETRTRDIQLGKLALYQLSYARDGRRGRGISAARGRFGILSGDAANAT
jgi:hypothetical protein